MMIWETIKATYFIYPSDDPLEASQGYFISLVNLVLAIFSIILMGLWLLGVRDALGGPLNIIYPVIYIGLYLLARLGYLQVARWLTLVGVALLVFSKPPIFVIGAILAYTVILSGLLINATTMFMTALLVSLLPFFTNFSEPWVDKLANVGSSLVVYLSLAYTVNRLLKQTQQSWEQSYTFALLEQSQDSLRHELANRTETLQKFFEMLDAFSRLAVASNDLESLFRQTVALMQRELQFEQVQGFSFNQQTEQLKLVYNIEVDDLGYSLDPTLIQTVIQTKQPMLVTRYNPDGMAELGFTQVRELAIPLQKGRETLGVLAIRCNTPALLDEAMRNLISVLVNQLTVALVNIRSVSDTQTALQQIESLNHQLTQQQWSQALARESVQSCVYTPRAVTLNQADTLPCMDLAQQQPELNWVELAGDGRNEIALLLRLRGETIGVLGLERAARLPWSEEEKSALQAIAEQISLALESARLFENTERNAWRDQLISESTARVWASTQIEQVMQAAVSQLGERLNASEVVIELNPEIELS